MPGNPVDLMLSKLATKGPVTPTSRAAIEAMLGTDSNVSLWRQYGTYQILIPSQGRTRRHNLAGFHICHEQWRQRPEDLGFMGFASDKGVCSPGIDRSNETDFGIGRSDRDEQVFDAAETPKSDPRFQRTLELSGQRASDNVTLAHHVGFKIGFEDAQRSVGDRAAARQQKEDLKDEQATLQPLEQLHYR